MVGVQALLGGQGEQVVVWGGGGERRREGWGDYRGVDGEILCLRDYYVLLVLLLLG